jgi:hypothetical protein
MTDRGTVTHVPGLECYLGPRLLMAHSYSKCNIGPKWKGDLGYSRLRSSAKRTRLRMTYHQITLEERYRLYALRGAGAS